MIDDLLQNVDEDTRKIVEAEFARLKKMFKTMSKNELIALLLEQVEDILHMKNINKLLINQVKELKKGEEQK